MSIALQITEFQPFSIVIVAMCLVWTRPRRVPIWNRFGTPRAYGRRLSVAKLLYELKEETSDGALRTENLHAPRRSRGRGSEALSGDRLSGPSEGRAGQKARRLLPERYRHDQSARASLEVR